MSGRQISLLLSFKCGVLDFDLFELALWPLGRLDWFKQNPVAPAANLGQSTGQPEFLRQADGLGPPNHEDRAYHFRDILLETTEVKVHWASWTSPAWINFGANCARQIEERPMRRAQNRISD